jgi:hypothetical protein
MYGASAGLSRERWDLLLLVGKALPPRPCGAPLLNYRRGEIPLFAPLLILRRGGRDTDGVVCFIASIFKKYILSRSPSP